MIENIFNSFKSDNINKIVICSDCVSEHLSNIVFDRIVEIILNKNVNNILLHNHTSGDGGKFNKNVNFDYFVLNLPYYITLNGDLSVDSNMKYVSDVILLLTNNDMTIVKHREMGSLQTNKIDMLPFIRWDKINRIKNNIYNKKILLNEKI